MATFCSKCGNELKEGARFCSVCGNPVKQVQSTQSEATAGTNEERQGVFSQQQGFTAQDMQYQQMAGSAAPVKKNKNLWLLAIPAAKNFDSAMNKSDFSLISGYLKNGSPIYTEQEKYVLHDITERLDSYELTNVSYTDANNCVISTRETYYVQVKGKPLQLMTQECKYNVENQGDKWQLTSFADIKVVSRIK